MCLMSRVKYFGLGYPILICVGMHGPTSIPKSHMSPSQTRTHRTNSKCQHALPPYLVLPVSHWPLPNVKTPLAVTLLFFSSHATNPVPPPPPPIVSHHPPFHFTTPARTSRSGLKFETATITMIKTLSPYSDPAKTAEIMSRYRPIAPKPEVPANPVGESSSMSQKFRQSPFLRNLWPQLQARPTRTRKRGRAALSPPTFKRPRSHVLGLASPSHILSPARHLSLQGFAPGIWSQLPIPNLASATSSFETNPIVTSSNVMTLPLLPCPTSVPLVADQAALPQLSCVGPSKEKLIDLNVVAEMPEEKDLLQQLLQAPPTTSNIVIAPRPVRLVGSSIRVGCISEDPSLTPPPQVPKKPEEVEEEVESEALPAVISDSNNRVRLANSAYKEMVGQPECRWLDTMVNSGGPGGSARCSGKRICGEVMLQLADKEVPASSNGFSCWVRIEWGSEGKKSSVNAFCDVIRLLCKSKDYLFTWRFHTHSARGREASQSSTNA